MTHWTSTFPSSVPLRFDRMIRGFYRSGWGGRRKSIVRGEGWEGPSTGWTIESHPGQWSRRTGSPGTGEKTRHRTEGLGHRSGPVFGETGHVSSTLFVHRNPGRIAEDGRPDPSEPTPPSFTPPLLDLGTRTGRVSLFDEIPHQVVRAPRTPDLWTCRTCPCPVSGVRTPGEECQRW